jgi:hypothetical protein
MLYIAQTGCQWRYLPTSFGPWTRVWSQFRRWSRNRTWAQALKVLHAAARHEDGRAEETPSMVVIDTHLARGASNGGFTFHDRGGPYGRTKGAKRVVAVDVTGLPVAALVVPASTHENRASELMLEHMDRQGVTDRLELVLVDRGSRPLRPAPSAATATSRSAGSGGTTSSLSSGPSALVAQLDHPATDVMPRVGHAVTLRNALGAAEDSPRTLSDPPARSGLGYPSRTSGNAAFGAVVTAGWSGCERDWAPAGSFSCCWTTGTQTGGRQPIRGRRASTSTIALTSPG